MAEMLTEAFKELQLLREENFDYNKQGIDALQSFLDADDLEDHTTTVIDASAEDEEDLEDSYVGKVVFECPVCKSLVYHGADDVEIDKQSELANVSDDCPYCHSVGGFNVIGEIAPYEKVEVKAEEEEKIEEPIEEACKHHSMRRRPMHEEDKPAAMSIEDAQKWIDYDMKKYGKISDRTDALVKKAGFQILKDDHGDYEVTAGHFEALSEDTVKQGNYWVNKGKEGTHGKFRTKKAADAQRRAMFAQGYEESLEEEKHVAPRTRDDIDAIADDKKERAKAAFMRKKDDADSDKDYQLKKNDMKEPHELKEEKDLTKAEGTIAKLLNDHMDEINKASSTLPELKEVLKKIVDESDLADTKEAARFKYTLDHAKNTSALLSTIGTWISGLKVESLEKVELETAHEKIEISSEDKREEEKVEDEMIEPVSQETAAEILVDNGEELPNISIDEVEELEDEEIEELGESYLKNVYENVDDFELKDVYKKEDKLVVEGLISFKSGANKPTTFSFTPKQVTRKGRVKFLGENLGITSNKNAFTLSGKIDGKKLIPESLTYNYGVKTDKDNTQRVYGRVKVANK